MARKRIGFFFVFGAACEVAYIVTVGLLESNAMLQERFEVPVLGAVTTIFGDPGLVLQWVPIVMIVSGAFGLIGDAQQGALIFKGCPGPERKILFLVSAILNIIAALLGIPGIPPLNKAKDSQNACILSFVEDIALSPTCQADVEICTESAELFCEAEVGRQLAVFGIGIAWIVLRIILMSLLWYLYCTWKPEDIVKTTPSSAVSAADVHQFNTAGSSPLGPPAARSQTKLYGQQGTFSYNLAPSNTRLDASNTRLDVDAHGQSRSPTTAISGTSGGERSSAAALSPSYRYQSSSSRPLYQPPPSQQELDW